MIKRFLRTCFLKSVALPGIAVLVFLPGSSVYAHPGDTPGPGQQGSSSAFLRELSSRETVTRADCMRAAGYDVRSEGLWTRFDGTLWARHTTRIHGMAGTVLERIVGADGRTFTDPSTWYWEAQLGRARGPWWAVTRMTRP